MPEYICTVKKANGSLIRKYKVKAADEPSLATQVKSNKLFLVDYKQKVERSKNLLGGSRITLSTKDIAILCRQLSSMLTSGVTLVKALNILYLQMEKKNIKECIKRLYESVQRGDQFSEGIRKQTGVFPEIMISMVEAGEASGKLDHVVTKLAEQFEKDVKLKSKMKSAMTYPIILMVMAIGVVLILVTQVLPIFIGMFAEGGMDLPVPTRILIAFSDILRGYWYLVIFGIAALALVIKIYLASDKGLKKWHSIQLKLPVVSDLVVKVSAVRFTRTLSTLLSSGMSLLQALEIVNKVVGNRVITDGLNTTKEDIRKGMNLSQSLRRVSALPPMVYSMTGIGEESGTIEDMLEKCAEYYDDEVENAIQKMVTMMEPIMIVFMGVVVGFIIISMILPIFDLYGSIE
ncbi:MAG TPA: type II secretion system F family protein [Anaerovoracaceae bacterium]|nr:type II secretion system F family protein [Anaerovoracaceae bacterium]